MNSWTTRDLYRFGFGHFIITRSNQGPTVQRWMAFLLKICERINNFGRVWGNCNVGMSSERGADNVWRLYINFYNCCGTRGRELEWARLTRREFIWYSNLEFNKILEISQNWLFFSDVNNYEILSNVLSTTFHNFPKPIVIVIHGFCKSQRIWSVPGTESIWTLFNLQTKKVHLSRIGNV